MAEPRRAAVGFKGGPVLDFRAEPDVLEKLGTVLAHGASGWHELRTQDGPVVLDLAQVVYFRVESHEQRIGF